MNYNWPGSSVHGILQARILEWVAISFSNTLRKPKLKKTCMPKLTAALFTTPGTWKQPRCPSTDECIKKLWYIYTMEYYSAIKWNTFESVLMRLMNPEPII